MLLSVPGFRSFQDRDNRSASDLFAAFLHAIKKGHINLCAISIEAALLEQAYLG